MPDPPPPIQIFRSTASNKTGVSSSAPVIGQISVGTGNQPRKVLRPVSQPLTPQTIQQLQSQGLLKSGGLTADGKRIIVVKKSATGTTLIPKIQSVSSLKDFKEDSQKDSKTDSQKDSKEDSM